MRLASEVPSDKLRGGYYTPDFIVDACIARIIELRGIQSPLSILEPSAGDGAFVRGLARSSLSNIISSVTCVEKLQSEAEKCSEEIRRSPFDGTVVPASFFSWAEAGDEEYDCLVGNPPFVRYQFVPPEDRRAAERILSAKGIRLAGVANLCIPFTLIGLDRLRAGGAMAMVLPSEVLCTVSGQQIRDALLRQIEDLQIDLFPRDAFEHISQDVVVFTGRKRHTAVNRSTVRFVEHRNGQVDSWTHAVAANDNKWTKYLLSAQMLSAFEQSRDYLDVFSLGDVARFTVAVVTGANAFFSVSQPTVEAYELDPWVRPLMARTQDSPGLVYHASDHAASVASGRPAWLLDFGADQPDPQRFSGPRCYLNGGRMSGLPERYKCRIRDPWYRVPHIWPGMLMMSKRANLHHRIVLNEAAVLTTDTVYRGRMEGRFAGRERDLVAGFHNSLTLLSAEVEGRTYGGGVLELVPSEISRLLVPLLKVKDHLSSLDLISRKAGGQRDAQERIVVETNRLISATLPAISELLPILEGARQRLQCRRLAAYSGLSVADS